MKKIHSVALAALAAPLLWAAVAPREHVEFKVRDGLELTKTFKIHTELSQDSMSTVVNGNEQDMGDLEMSMVSDEVATVTDVYGAMASGKPAKLKRTYDKLTNRTSMDIKHPMMGEREMEYVGESELEGKTVNFALGEDGEYQAVFDESSKADDELLEGLWEDMDLRPLLPTSEVKAGDSWKIDNSSLPHLLAPGGNLKIVPEASGDDEMGMGGGAQPGISDMLGDVTAQEATGTFTGIEERDGTKVGVIAIKLVKLTSAKDMTEYAQRALESEERPEGMEFNIESADVEIEINAEGELLWNLEGGHLHALELSGTVSFTQDSNIALAMQGQKMKVESTTEMSGSFTRSVVLGSAD